MLRIADKLNTVEELLQTNPKAALDMLTVDITIVDNELECITKLGREIVGIQDSLSRANIILKSHGKDSGKIMSNKDITNAISEDAKTAIKHIKNAAILFSQLQEYMNRLE